MKNLILFLIYTASLFAMEQIENYKNEVVYNGFVFNSSKSDRVESIFRFEGEKLISGKYIITEYKDKAMGRIYDCFSQNKDFYICKWEDKYGDGYLKILFSSDKNRFNGFWGDNENKTIYFWNGKR
jgi:hypothetical protein